MNTAAVTQAVSDFPWGLVIVALIVGGLVYVWKSGLLGKPAEDRIKAKRDALLSKGRAYLGKAAAEEAKLAVVTAPAVATVEAINVPRDKGTEIISLHDALTKGALTQAEFDAEKAKILA